MNIRTKYVTNGNGRGQILATGGGKQRTVNYEDAHSVDWNHGNAAGTLLLAIGGFGPDDDYTHTVESGTIHRFTARAFN